MWQGLGYNRRALFLKRAAIIVVERYGGRLPRGREALESLPGIGKGTSGSLMAFAFNRPEIFIETNIRRVFIHFFFNGRSNVTDAELERYIRSSVDEKRAKEWYWALMDYGAAMSVPFDDKKNTLESVANPNRRSAHYKKQSSFVGSDRALRGKIIRSTLSVGRNKIDAKELFKKLNIPSTRFEMLVGALEKEGFIVRKGNYIFIKK
jgi:A/G-specific adenine glycosylase